MRSQSFDRCIILTQTSQGSNAKSLVEAFERQVARRGDAMAVCDRHRGVSYSALDTAANAVAQQVLARVQGSNPIAVMMSPGVAGVVAILGILKSARPYVILDPGFAPQRLQNLVEDAATSLIVVAPQTGLATKLAERTGCLFLDISPAMTTLEAKKPDVAPAPHDLAWIHYTSGSTGNPKGVIQRHGDSVHFINAFIRCVTLDETDHTTMLHGFLSLDLFGPLLAGACLHIFNLKRRGFTQLASWIHTSRITVLSTLPTTFRAMTTTLNTAGQFSQVRQVRLGGEPVVAKDVVAFERLFPQRAELFNWLGSTETGIAYDIVERGAPAARGYLRRRIPDTALRVIDENGASVGVGEIGEIEVSSRHLFPGYWGQPELTRSVISSDPMDPSRRRFNTGDMGRLHHDGALEYLGRQDLQVKIRGNAVALLEVETVMTSLPAVRRAAVTSFVDANGSVELVAFFVAEEQGIPESGMLRETLSELLPAHMVPTRLEPLLSLPLTPGGKIDRHKLQNLKTESAHRGIAGRAPAGAIETAIAGVWCDCLALDAVDAEVSFWDVGGDSLQALEVLAKINTALGVELTPEVLLHETSISDLAERLSNAVDMTSDRSPCLLKFCDGDERPPLYCIHHHLGTAFCFRELARELGPGQPVYGLQARGLSGQCHERIEEMAGDYLTELRTVQPEGPYHLLGYCFGGWVALEMASQLQSQGESVGLLAMIDLQGPGRRRQSVWERLVHRYAVESANLAALDSREKRVYMMNRVKATTKTLLGNFGVRRPKATTLAPGRLQSVAEANDRAQRVYQPSPVSGALLLFRSPYPLVTHYSDPQFGWSPVVDDTQVCFVHGPRLEGAGAKVIATHLTAALEVSRRENTQTSRSAHGH